MNKLIVVPAMLLLLACQDHNPVQPAPELTPELALAQARGGPGNVVKMLPFKGKGAMWYVAEAEGDDSFCEELDGWASGQTAFLESQGTSTQMGRVTATITSCYGEGPPYARPILLFRQNMRAANGDLVFAEGQPDHPEMPYQFIVYADMSWEVRNVRIVGGTGRFENATGWWGCYGNNILAQRINWTCDGEISSVGSSK